jgi:hypothetical protein
VIKIDVRAEFGDVIRRLQRLEKDIQPKVIVRTLNTIGESAKVQARKEISREFNMSSGEVGKLIRVQKARIKGNVLEVAVIAESRRGRSLNVVRFVEKSVTLAARRRRRKEGTLDRIRVKIKRAGRNKILGTPKWAAGKPFIVTANGGTFVAARTTKERSPIQGVQTIDVPSMFNTRRINDVLLRQIRQQFPREFDRQFSAALRGF